ncbi:hypothetical protein [Mycobacteroides chelonae]|uniref:hypothetical protein n=1 Tax=Mycobacteroides chelonae TaxID=1774 RepID=UPI001F2F4F74|nr:hypothetical protein [Mycobacteroides chelonae]
MPDVPGVKPVLLGACALSAEVVGSCWPLVALVTAVVIVAAAAGRSGSGTDGTLGRTVLLGAWCCSDGWWACAPCPAGVVPDAAPREELVLGAVALPEKLAFPEMSPARVGFTLWGAADGAGALEALGDSELGALVARGISGSFCGSACGPSPVIPRCTAVCSTVGAVGDAAART